MQNSVERFLSKFDPCNDACWVWGAFVDKLGYGQFRLNGRARLAHKISYELFRGPVASGFELDHLCRNSSCVNPWHLEAVTHAENIRRGIGTGNRKNRTATHCPHGHEYSESNTYWRPDGTGRGCRTCRNRRAA